MAAQIEKNARDKDLSLKLQEMYTKQIFSVEICTKLKLRSCLRFMPEKTKIYNNLWFVKFDRAEFNI